MDKIVFLDWKKYPNSDRVLDILKETHEVFVVFDNDTYIEGQSLLDNGSKFFTIIPEIEAEFSVNYPGNAYINCLPEQSLKEFRRYLNKSYPGILLERMKLTYDNIDPLKLAKIFESSPNLSVKIQTNGTPFVSKYEGLDSFLMINNLSAGIVTPATQIESDSAESDVLYPNHDYIVQAIPKDSQCKFVMVKVTERVARELTWYDIEEMEIPENILNALTNLEFTAAYFMYVKELKDFKISAILSGINYHIDPKHYV